MGDGELVETQRAPAGSVPSAMYALRGARVVLRARGANYFASKRMSGSPATYRLKFPVSPAPESLIGATKSVFTLGDCKSLQF